MSAKIAGMARSYNDNGIIEKNQFTEPILRFLVVFQYKDVSPIKLRQGGAGSLKRKKGGMVSCCF